MNQDLKIIKKYYGEKMMHLCRELFPTLLETKGLLIKLMLDSFAPSKFLYSDIIENNRIVDFKNYIYSLIETYNKVPMLVTRTPKELLSELGYDLYECRTEDDIQKFKKYYTDSEKLCTFNGGRLNSCYVFFAVKKNATKIKRSNNPEREDDYGRSVISIQFTRGNINTLSIKNRYNHTVNNPDATYSNNLENIKEGLTDSFEKYYNLNIVQNDNSNFELPGYVKANDGRFYKYNYEINNIYYCPNNIIIDNFIPKQLDKEKYIVLDYFILDLVNKKIKVDYSKDSFVNDIKDIKKITIIKDKLTLNKKIEIVTQDKNKIIIEIDKLNQIIGYKNEKITEIGNDFLFYNKTLNNLELPSVQTIGNNFLRFNHCLTELSLPNLKNIGDEFIAWNKRIYNINLPKLEKVGNSFLRFNMKLKTIEFPNLELVGSQFLVYNNIIKDVHMPKLVKAGSYFLSSNQALIELELPSLEIVGSSFLDSNEDIIKLFLPKLKILEDDFLSSNKILTNIELPELQEVGNNFLLSNLNMESLTLPKLVKVGNCFFKHNKRLTNLELLSLEEVGDKFFYTNRDLVILKLLKLKYVGNDFFHDNEKISQLELPSLISVGNSFIIFNREVTILDLPNLVSVGNDFMTVNYKFKKVNLPELDYENKIKIPYFRRNQVKKGKIKIR